ncbi:hypothetical protein AcidC75_18780 [Acidisoma sp. C75]
MRRERDCPICLAPGRQGLPTKYRRDAWRIVSCRQCGFAFLPEVPLASAFAEELAWENTHAEEAAFRKKNYPLLDFIDQSTKWRFRIFPRVQPADIVNKFAEAGPVIDLGCGNGGFSAALKPGLTPYGIEISAGLARSADAVFARKGGRAIQMAAADGIKHFQDAFFSAAILRSYLEHDADARDVLCALRPKMRPGSIVVVKVPNFDSLNRKLMQRRWCGFRYPDHCNYFTKSSLHRLAGSAGFTMTVPWYLGLPTDDNLIAILRPKPH